MHAAPTLGIRHFFCELTFYAKTTPGYSDRAIPSSTPDTSYISPVIASWPPVDEVIRYEKYACEAAINSPVVETCRLRSLPSLERKRLFALSSLTPGDDWSQLLKQFRYFKFSCLWPEGVSHFCSNPNDRPRNDPEFELTSSSHPKAMWNSENEIQF